jgi:hypothetical protein
MDCRISTVKAWGSLIAPPLVHGLIRTPGYRGAPVTAGNVVGCAASVGQPGP